MGTYCNTILIIISFLLFSVQLHSQDHQCISESHLEHHPELAKEYHKKIAQVLADRDSNRFTDNLGLITIPVVVHVIHNTDAQNISDAQVQSQIDVLNTAFDLEAPWITAIYPQASDVEIKFVLANVDPDGNTTDGITRTNTSVGIFSIVLEQPLDWQQNTYMKLDSEGGKDAWPTDEYLNIWVINCQYYIKGFGTFPNSIASNLDGVVVNYKYFGNIEAGTTYVNYAEGKSCVHEVGHWLDLRHIFANNNCTINDGLADTPAQENFYFSCAAPITECGNSLMLENYMQYTYDQCQMVYTEDQKTVMRSNFLAGGSRESLLTSPGYLDDGLSRIFGNFYHDIDEDQIIDSNEALYAGVQISLYNCNDQLINTITSDNQGFYEFVDIPAGQYYLIVNKNTLPSGKGPDPIWLTPNGCANISGSNDYLQSFGLLNYGSLSGNIWEDMNTDGIMQSSEPSINNISINLRKNNGLLMEQINPSASGSYTFTEVYPQDYYIEFMLNSTYNVTEEGVGNNNTDSEVANYNGINTTQITNIAQGQHVNNIGAGFFVMAEISGHVWQDTDYDGTIDNNENGTAGVNVSLYDDQFMLVTNESTDSDGKYTFTDVYPGNYHLQLDLPNGTAIIPQTSQSNYFDQSNGPNTSPSFDFLSGYVMDDLNAGLGLGTVALEDIILKGSAQNDHILLDWIATSTLAENEFNLQKEIAGTWTTIHTSSMIGMNSFQDFDVQPGTNYYRLSTIDNQGQEQFSNIVAVDFFNLETMLFFQNPIEEKLYITFNNSDFTKIEVSIFDNQRRLHSIEIYGSELDANHQIAIDFRDYPAGIYFINYEIGSFHDTKKLVKLH